MPLMTSDQVVMAVTLLSESSCTSFLNMPLSRSPPRSLRVCACARMCVRVSRSSHQGQHLSYSHFLLRQTQTQTLKRALQWPDLRGPGKESSLVDERSINLSATSSLSLFLTPPNPPFSSPCSSSTLSDGRWDQNRRADGRVVRQSLGLLCVSQLRFHLMGLCAAGVTMKWHRCALQCKFACSKFVVTQGTERNP